MSTTETALEPTTVAIEQIAEIVANHAVFQAAVQKYDEAGARKHIHKSYYRPEAQIVDAPFAIIFEAAGMVWERRADSTVTPKGELFLHLGMLIEADDDSESEERRFNNWHGQIAMAISKYDGAGYRMTTTVTDPPSRTHPKDAAKPALWEVGYSVAWGLFA